MTVQNNSFISQFLEKPLYIVQILQSNISWSQLQRQHFVKWFYQWSFLPHFQELLFSKKSLVSNFCNLTMLITEFFKAFVLFYFFYLMLIFQKTISVRQRLLKTLEIRTHLFLRIHIEAILLHQILKRQIDFQTLFLQLVYQFWQINNEKLNKQLIIRIIQVHTMNRFRNIMGKSPIPILQSSNTTKLQPQALNASDRKYRNYHKDGPQLLVTKILMINGPLQNKQIWRMYSRMLKENEKKGNPQKFDYWQSLTQLKRTLKFMRTNEKIKSSGYDRKQREHKGWQIQQKVALRYVHPEIIEQIQKAIDSKDTL